MAEKSAGVRNMNTTFYSFDNARAMLDEMQDLTRPGGDFTIRNFVGVIKDMSVEACTVETDLFPLGALEYYAKKNMGEDYTKEEQEMYQLDIRGGEQGDYSFGIKRKIANVIACLQEHPYSKRAVLPIPFANEPSTAVDYSNQGQTKCVRELYFYIESGLLKCTGVLRMQNANIFPKNIYFISKLMNYVADELGLDIGEYTHFVTNLCFDRTARHC